MHHAKQFQLRIQHKMVSKREVYKTDKRKTLSSYLESKNEGALETRKPSEISDIFPQSLQDDDSLTSKDGISRDPFLLSSSREEHREGNHHYLANSLLKVQICNEQDVVPDLKGNPYIRHSTNQSEVERLRLELKNTLAMYNQACRDLVYARNKVKRLLAEYSDDAKKVKDALEREEMLKKIAAEEKARHLEAIKEVEAARQLLAKEAHERQIAEMNALKELSERNKLVEALISSGERCRRYSKAEIESATDCFSEAKKIGEGGYGIVYKCNLYHTPVAVKVLHQDASDKKDQFLKEVEILSQLRHPHMVLLLGACPENGSLVYEYMENGSLEDRIFCHGGTPPLPWFIRFRIVFEMACGLAFLHGSKPEPIVHRDLKPGNILLDKHYVSKIGDVGLSKLMSNVVPDSITEYRDTVLAGTFFYMDPEYQRTGTIRPKSDLYAFGIIILQLLTAKQAQGLVTTVESAIDSGLFEEILDNSITDWPLAETEKLATLALKCSALRCRDRPDLESEVMPVLEELLYIADVHCKLQQQNVDASSHYFCPILQEVMEDPHIAADGFTYEHRAIRAWLERHSISPVTKLSLPHSHLIPNHSLRSAIQEWKVHSKFSSPS
ncbi:U-box domain-containing protein 34 [Cinnamomum micranthum f. kanehirae]|uniref:RING-type E3 ubiquitin transferase n=1 Tax=Cinnamomum micranthum f. kanehirae TaxID=337451 RepID=A0A443PDQ6_9MAGN|nr:U-box domain-containing protein 34 [Cinnamomum micranthum f. kanehirae]